ncbi:hypothetical protein [Clostridium grantii]|uniref:Uncharacterized protein n=1 Tax=Clostridium grantii DSM 8605 TaxID=1121316 RepID=A0A1M5W228_9CLOT|nr:hypothetical protein [Clostridium grantii]SHH81552.1 hypothetical protein SAMN02745207_02635 [Clostridium grantii DSM 8605]
MIITGQKVCAFICGLVLIVSILMVLGNLILNYDFSYIAVAMGIFARFFFLILSGDGNNMEIFGLMAFALVISDMGLKDKVKKLKKDVRKINSKKEEVKMSEILKELEGKRCRLTVSEIFAGQIECDVITVDDEWMKISLNFCCINNSNSARF